MIRLGVTVKKASPDLMMVIHLTSPDGTRTQQYISNYATLYVKDVLARVDGVGDVQVFGARDYAMRIWLDPAKMAARELTAGDVVAALQANNLQVAAGAPCLLVSRRTWSGGRVASMAKLYHPGDRFRLGGRFNPNTKAVP